METTKNANNSDYDHNKAAFSTMPDFSRYLSISKDIGVISLTRALQYEFIRNYPFQGTVLDIGGGELTGYRQLLNCSSYDSINIDHSTEPTWIVGVGEAFPCSSGSYDTVISFNTLEHIFDAQFVLREMQRVLKSGGNLWLTTPFLFPIHGHPDDFFRPTPSWYNQALTEAGFKNIVVFPLAWGPLTTGQVCSGSPGPFRSFRRQIALITDLLYAKLQTSRKQTTAFDYLNRFATAFLVHAEKSVSVD